MIVIDGIVFGVVQWCVAMVCLLAAFSKKGNLWCGVLPMSIGGIVIMIFAGGFNFIFVCGLN